jgi:predicted ATPase/DNA-binding winged helix-turn-helix (wHTH) protein
MNRLPAIQFLEVITFDSFRLFPAARRLEHDGIPVKIGSRALDILIVLLEKAGEPVGQRELITRVWRGMVVEESSLRVNIVGLRRVLGDGGKDIKYIANIPGQGYCFVAPVSHSHRDDTPANGQRQTTRTAYPLPKRLERMVGRDKIVAQLATQVLAHRFVNIIGPGGMGKTTTAIAIAHALLDDFDGAVCFFDLGGLNSPDLLATSMMATLGLMTTANDPALYLTAWLQDKKLLLVLDNCEHLIDAVAVLAERLFHDAPHVFILATSREALRAEGEHAHRLLPLASPAPCEAMTAAQAMSYPAVQLFVERAIASGNHFEFNDADAPVVAEICHKLDGIALAIELGAARVAALGVRGTAEMLDYPFRLSWQGRRTALPRHQTLNAMLDWSYNLLPEYERLVLRRLSTYVGPFSLDAAGYIAGDDDTDKARVIAAVDSLVAKSLASAEIGQPTIRYRLLDSVRVYAAEKLRESGEANLAARRNSEYSIGYLERMQFDATTFPVPSAASNHIACIGNIRACLEWSFSDPRNYGMGTRLFAAAAPLMLGLSLREECRRWAEKSLAVLRAEDTGGRQEMALREALAISSMFTKGNSDSVMSSIELGVALAQKIGNLPYELRLLAGLNIFRQRIGDFSGALAVAARSTMVAQALGDNPAMAMAEWMLGASYHLIGNQAEAQRHCETGMAHIAGACNASTLCFGHDHRIRALVVLARALWLRGNPEQAVKVAWQAITDAERLDHPISLCIALIFAAPVFTWNGDWQTADELIDKLIVYAKKHMLAPYLAVGKGLKGELLVKRGEPCAGVTLLCECLAVLRSGQHHMLNTVFMTALAEGLTAMGEYDEALVLIGEAAAKGIERFDSPEILRIQGHLLASVQPPNVAQAEENLRRSLECARRQQSLGWELRSATTLSRLLFRQGRQDEARRLLGDVHARFTCGFHTADYIEAGRLLAEMQPA